MYCLPMLINYNFAHTSFNEFIKLITNLKDLTENVSLPFISCPLLPRAAYENSLLPMLIPAAKSSIGENELALH